MQAVLEQDDKQMRLVAAAVTCFHHSGYARVSLAEIAAAAGVPVGNIYYYFKTKAALAEAVVKTWQARQNAFFDKLNKLPHARERLVGMLKAARNHQDVYAEFGCPLANLARDLRAAGEATLSDLASAPYARSFAWVEAQFVELGEPPVQAAEHASFFIATLQGGILMAHVHEDGRFVDRQSQYLTQWLDTLKGKSV
jgi:AcrR family transcriptional regulator